MRFITILCLAAFFLYALVAVAENPIVSPSSQAFNDAPSPSQKGATQWGILSGGATGLAGGVREGVFWILQFRWGNILTSPHGPGFLRGTIEYAFEAVPAMLIRQSSTVYGGGFNPLILQYNFTYHPKLTPYILIGGGMLFTTEQVPVDTSRFNFTPQGGVGINMQLWDRESLEFGIRYHHISNASTAPLNPGRNSILLHVGFSWWR